MDRLLENAAVYDRILVVEDEARLRELWQRALREMGLVGVGARSGEEALTLAEQFDFGIAMLDLNLPGMNGLEVFRQLRERFPDLAVIIVTGFGTLEAAQRAIQLGVVEFLTKPCGLGELEVAIDRARRRYRAQNTPASSPEHEAEVAEESGPPPVATMTEIERQTILDALKRNDGNRAVTARELGISIRTLYYRLAEYQRQGFVS